MSEHSIGSPDDKVGWYKNSRSILNILHGLPIKDINIR